MNRLDIYETPEGWRVGIWAGRRRVRWPKAYKTRRGASTAYRNTARAHRIYENKVKAREATTTTTGKGQERT